ncbi:MAG: hypothetical protein HQL58_10470 [Magnetococcales bacterium]|nr:hypothetical protein [Magnetococcales bacterium]
MHKTAPGPARYRALRIALALTTIGMTSALTGCSSILSFFKPDKTDIKFVEAKGQDVDLVDMSHKMADALAVELIKRYPGFLQQNNPVLVASFVTRGDLDSSSELGLLIADHVASRLTQQGFTVLEPKLTREVALRVQQGDFVLSRDADKLPKEYKIYAVVTGTYTQGYGMVDFTTRMIRVQNQQVLASVDARLPIGLVTHDLLRDVGGGGKVMPVVDR